MSISGNSAPATSPPGRNQRRSRLREAISRVAVRFWFGRNVYLTAIGYAFLLIFFGINLATLESGSATSIWSPPSESHIFGVNARGQDVFHVSLALGEKSVSAAILSAFFGVGLAVLAGWGVALTQKAAWGFRLLRNVSRFGGFFPALLIALIVSAGWGAGFWKLIFLFTLLSAIITFSRITDWFEELESRGETVAATVTGLSKGQIILQNHIIFIMRRAVSLACGLIPALALGETALSFIGFGLGPESWGGILAEGMEVLFEAPWLTIYPGIVVTITITALSLLGWMARKAMNGDLPPRIF